MKLAPSVFAAAALMVAAGVGAAQGNSSTRPQLSAAQAKQFSYGEVLKYVGAAGKESVDPWDPLTDPLARGAAFTPDYIVDHAAKADGVKTFNTIQQAVNRAVLDSAAYPARRLYMLVRPGTYHELVYVPVNTCLLYTSPSPRDQRGSRMPSSA